MKLNSDSVIFQFMGKKRSFLGGRAIGISRARYYDPQAGRFLSRDPIGFKGGINYYTYARNNAVNRKDPLGLQDLFIGDTWTNALRKCHQLNKTTADRCQCFCDLQPIADTTPCIKSCNNCYELFENRSAVELCKCLCKEQGKDEQACNCMCEGFKAL